MEEITPYAGAQERVLGCLKWIVGGILMLSYCLVIPLFVPFGLVGWIDRYVCRLGTVSACLCAVLCYAHFILLVMLMFRTKRLWAFLLALAVLTASTWAAYVAFPVLPSPR